MPLKQFVKLVRCQTPKGYRLNEALLQNVLRAYCRDYEHADDLIRIASEGTRVRLPSPLPSQEDFPRNPPSATQRINVLHENIRKEQDAYRCLVIDADIKTLWPERFISPFRVVEKGTGNPLHSFRVIHDLAWSDGESVNFNTDQANIISASFKHCASIAWDVLRCQGSTPTADINLMAGDVTLAYHNAGIYSDSVHLFAGYIPEANAIVMDPAAAFGWAGRSGTYGVLGGAVAHIHGSCTNSAHAAGFYNHHWVNDHVNVTHDAGTNCADIDCSLRHAMTLVMGPAVN
jgi:hypothetical protein